MNLTEHFTLADFVRSATALDLGIDNALPEELMPAAIETCEMLERIREALSLHAGHEVPMIMTSGYRCLALNRAKRSKDTSDHVQAAAADWVAPRFGTPYEIAAFLAPRVSELGIGQLIHEFGAWVHTGRPLPAKMIDRIITITARGPEVGVQRA